jgi:hypothetical protein
VSKVKFFRELNSPRREKKREKCCICTPLPLPLPLPPLYGTTSAADVCCCADIKSAEASFINNYSIYTTVVYSV